MKIDGVNILTEFGIGVSKSYGLFDSLKRKQIIKHSWSDQHGEDYFVNSGDIIFETRQISFDFILKARDGYEFQHKLNRFIALLDKPGLRCISIDKCEKPFYVYCKDGARLNVPKPLSSGLNVAQFKMDFIEPEPVYPFFEASVNSGGSINMYLKMNTGLNVRVYWGDGEWTDFNSTIYTNISHTYQAAGVYKVAILQNLDDLKTIQALNQGAIQGNIANVLNNIPPVSIDSIKFNSCAFTYYSGGKIPGTLSELNLSGNDLVNSDEVNRIVQDLLNDGTAKVTERSPTLIVDLTGAGMPVCTDWISYDAVDSSITINVNGVHP